MDQTSLTFNGPWPLFSVVITNYNYARYLRQCIESVLSQDHPNFEVIVVDDGSSDESGTIIESFGDRIRPVYKANGGMISSWNTGWAHSRGDMILILDADDFLLPGALLLHTKALTNENIVHSQGYQRVVDRTGKPTGRYYPSQRPQDNGVREIVLTFGPCGYFAAATSGNAWSRKFCEKVFPLQDDRILAGDALLLDIAPLYGKSVTADRAVAVYRLHEGSMSDGKALFTPQNIAASVAGYNYRAMRLKATAESLGFKVQVAKWRGRNWRMATLRYIHGKLMGSADTPRLTEHLRTATGCRNPVKTALVFLAILSMRLLPLPACIGIANKMIKLQEI